MTTRPAPTAAVACLLALLTACQSPPPAPGSPPAAGARGGAGGRGLFSGPPSPAAGRVAEPRENDPSMNWADPCAANMGAVVEALLLYYGKNRKLPPSLNDLPTTTLDGGSLARACPVSGKPYQYVPAGLGAPADLIPTGMRLLVYDADPAHTVSQRVAYDNKEYDLRKPVRYGIVLRPHEPGEPVEMYVVPIEQSLLDLYLRSAQH